MNLFRKKRLAVAITVYWVLLAYIVAGLVFWFIELQRKNSQMATYELHQLKLDDPSYESRYNEIQTELKRKTGQ